MATEQTNPELTTRDVLSQVNRRSEWDALSQPSSSFPFFVNNSSN